MIDLGSVATIGQNQVLDRVVRPPVPGEEMVDLDTLTQTVTAIEPSADRSQPTHRATTVGSKDIQSPARAASICAETWWRLVCFVEHSARCELCG